MVVLAFGSYRARMVGVVNSCLSFANASSCTGVHSQAFLSLSNSRNGFDNSAMFGENFPTMPRNLRSSGMDLGVSICSMEAILLGSADIPWGLITCPRKVRWFLQNSHLLLLSVTLAEERCFNTA